MTSAQRDAAFETLEEEGSICRVDVEGVRTPLYMLALDLPLMENVLADSIDRKARLEFLAPLDPMLWDRKLIEALWDYRYSWEIYTPVEKRKYGYYVLPILYGDSLIGRIEAVADRKSEMLHVKNIWYEEGVRQTKKMAAAIDNAVAKLATFNGFHNRYVYRKQGTDPVEE